MTYRPTVEILPSGDMSFELQRRKAELEERLATTRHALTETQALVGPVVLAMQETALAEQDAKKSHAELIAATNRHEIRMLDLEYENAKNGGIETPNQQERRKQQAAARGYK